MLGELFLQKSNYVIYSYVVHYVIYFYYRVNRRIQENPAVYAGPPCDNGMYCKFTTFLSKEK